MVQPILVFVFYPKNVTNFACFQTLKVTRTCAWKNNIRGRIVFYLSTTCSL